MISILLFFCAYLFLVEISFIITNCELQSFSGDVQKGAFSIAAKTKVPVVPITLIGTGQIMPAGRESIVNTGFVKVVIHKPIDGNDPDMLCKEARNKIASVLTQA